MIYDSSYDSLDPTTAANFKKLFNMPLTYKMAESQKQKGGADCGAFSIANVTAIALYDTGTPVLQFDQNKIHAHLAHCLEKNCSAHSLLRL